MRTLILPALFIAAAVASVPMRDACSEDASVVANIQENDSIQVRHAVVGESIPCYSVVVTQAGKEVRGFVLGSALPAIREFERTRALESRISVPVPPEAAPEKLPPLRPVGPQFELWNGVDIKGKRLQIAATGAKATLITFWSIDSGAARRYVASLKKTEGEFTPKGLRSFGMIEAGNIGRANYYLEDMGLDSPQAFDRQGLAAKYKADPVKGTTLVVDGSNNVVAVSSNPIEIRAVLSRLLSLN